MPVIKKTSAGSIVAGKLASRTGTAFIFALLLATGGCDLVQQQMGLENPAAKAARNDSEGKAVGGACRQSGRAIEDCYALNRRTDKAAIFAGWRDMNDYMRENKIEEVPPTLVAQAVSAKSTESKPSEAKTTARYQP